MGSQLLTFARLVRLTRSGFEARILLSFASTLGALAHRRPGPTVAR